MFKDNHMNKVILYGINRFQNKLENLLSSKYEVTGYSILTKNLKRQNFMNTNRFSMKKTL